MITTEIVLRIFGFFTLSGATSPGWGWNLIKTKKLDIYPLPKKEFYHGGWYEYKKVGSNTIKKGKKDMPKECLCLCLLRGKEKVLAKQQKNCWIFLFCFKGQWNGC